MGTPSPAGRAASGKGGPRLKAEQSSPPRAPACLGPSTLCMATSHAVDCLRLALASSPAVSFSWVVPSAPGAVYCRDMPVARALPPEKGRQSKNAHGEPQPPRIPAGLACLPPTPHAGTGPWWMTLDSQDGEEISQTGPPGPGIHHTTSLSPVKHNCDSQSHVGTPAGGKPPQLAGPVRVRVPRGRGTRAISKAQRSANTPLVRDRLQRCHGWERPPPGQASSSRTHHS